MEKNRVGQQPYLARFGIVRAITWFRTLVSCLRPTSGSRRGRSSSNRCVERHCKSREPRTSTPGQDCLRRLRSAQVRRSIGVSEGRLCRELNSGSGKNRTYPVVGRAERGVVIHHGRVGIFFTINRGGVLIDEAQYINAFGLRVDGLHAQFVAGCVDQRAHVIAGLVATREDPSRSIRLDRLDALGTST